MSRADVRFPSGDGACAGWLYRPEAPGPWPCVVLGHGFGAVRAGGLARYAECFQAAGFGALVFDYRHFGDSPGQPRQLLDIAKQLEDWRAALAWVRAQPEVDRSRIAIWGTSFGGGHVLSIAAEDHDLAAAVSQVPFGDGRVNGNTGGARQAVGLTLAGLRDRLRAARGRPPYYVPIVAAPGTLAAMNAPDCVAGYASLFDDPADFDNRVAARVVLTMPGYRPATRGASIRCPLLVQLADEDSVAKPGPAALAGQFAVRGVVRRYPAGHFEPYSGPLFEHFVAEQVAFLTEHLTGPREPAPPAPHQPRRGAGQRFGLEGRTVLVTGGASGIGAGLARAVHDRGASVAVLDIDAAAAARTADAIGARAEGWGVDVTDAARLDEVVADVLARFDRIDVAVANAGITSFDPVELMDPAEFRRVIDVNLVGTWQTLRATLAPVREASGYLLAMASVGGHAHSPLQSHYAASKAGVEAAADALRIELAPTGVRVGVGYPSFVETPMAEQTRADTVGPLIWRGAWGGPAKPLPVEQVVAALVDGIEKRKRRIVVPRGAWPLVLAGGLLQPLTDRTLIPNVADAIYAARRARRAAPHPLPPAGAERTDLHHGMSAR